MTPQIGTPLVRDISPATPSSQTSLTKRDQELQAEEGRPPIDVEQTEQDALYWKQEKDNAESEKRPKRVRPRSAAGSQTPAESDSASDTCEWDHASTEDDEDQEEAGHLFDSRS